MLVTRFTPKVVKTMLAIEALALAGLIVPAQMGLISRHGYIEELLGLGFGALARGVAVAMFFEIASEYRNVRLSRLAWQALGINAALLFFKGVASSGVIDVFIENYHSSPLRGLLNHLLGVPASVFLLFGLVGLLEGYRRAGLGPKLERLDYAIMAISLALFGWVLVFHRNLEEGQSPWMINRLLQPIDLSLIATASIVSIVLYRYATSLSGGKLAEALRWLVIYGLMPGVLVLVIQIESLALLAIGAQLNGSRSQHLCSSPARLDSLDVAPRTNAQKPIYVVGLDFLGHRRSAPCSTNMVHRACRSLGNLSREHRMPNWGQHQMAARLKDAVPVRHHSYHVLLGSRRVREAQALFLPRLKSRVSKDQSL